MKSIKLLPLSCILALALAGCLGPTPSVAPKATSTPNTAGYPAVATPTSPGPAYPAGATPTAATIQATTAATIGPSDTPGAGAATETAVPAATVADTAAPQPSATAATVFMTYQDFEIVPSQKTIKAGTKVTFLIKSASGVFHQPFSLNPAGIFEAPAELGDGTSYSFTFTQAGTIVISCGYHEDLMKATLTIEP